MDKTFDLRTALEALKGDKKNYLEIDKPVNKDLEIAGIYRKVGAGGSVMGPATGIGPALVFNNVNGYPGTKMTIGVLGNRDRAAKILGTEPEKLGFVFKDALDNPIPPVISEDSDAPCRQVVYESSAPGFDIRKILPAAAATEKDAGSYISMGLCYVRDPENGDGNLSIHRMCLQGEDYMTLGIGGYRHMGEFRDKAKKLGKPLPVAISIGVDPAIYIAACFQTPTSELGSDELSIAGGVRKSAVELVRCLTIDAYAIKGAEFVIEGELYPDEKVMEDQHTNTGCSLPEFAGYMGEARNQSIVKVKAVTCRENPIMQMCLAPSDEHVCMEGIAAEASILRMLEKAMPGKVKNVYGHPGGGGKLLTVIQFEKSDPSDEGKQKQAALLTFGICPELKNIILVDTDIDLFDSNELLWAMTTRFKPDMDLGYISNVRCHRSDPTQNLYYDSSLRDAGLGTKTIYDFTVPFDAKAHFVRAEFVDVDLSEYITE